MEVTLQSAEDVNTLRELVRLAGQRGKIIGAGTIVSPDQVALAAEAGARYLESPGLDPRVVLAAHHQGIPILPGVSTPS